MPEFAVREVHLPELHLPEIERDQIARALSGVHLPQVELARTEPRNVMARLGSVMARRGVRGLPPIDVGQLVAAAITASRLVRPARPRSRWFPVRQSRGSLRQMMRPAPRRSRRRLLLWTVAIAALAGWAFVRSPAGRLRLERASARLRSWVEDHRPDRTESADLEVGEPVATTTVEPAADTTDVAASPVV